MSIYTNSASSTPAETEAYVAGLLGLLANQDPLEVLRKTPTALEQFLDYRARADPLRSRGAGQVGDP